MYFYYDYSSTCLISRKATLHWKSQASQVLPKSPLHQIKWKYNLLLPWTITVLSKSFPGYLSNSRCTEHHPCAKHYSGVFLIYIYIYIWDTYVSPPLGVRWFWNLRLIPLYRRWNEAQKGEVPWVRLPGNKWRNRIWCQVLLLPSPLKHKLEPAIFVLSSLTILSAN